MRNLTKSPLGILLLITSIVWINCSSDNNPVVDLNDPSTLPGNYNLVSITDKTGDTFDLGSGLTFRAGESNSFTIDVNGVQITGTATVTGTLNLTDTRYTISTSLTATVPGFTIPPQSDTDTGTYSISGSTITIDSDDPNEPTQTATISTSGSQITIEDTDSRFVLEKQ